MELLSAFIKNKWKITRNILEIVPLFHVVYLKQGKHPNRSPQCSSAPQTYNSLSSPQVIDSLRGPKNWLPNVAVPIFFLPHQFRYSRGFWPEAKVRVIKMISAILLFPFFWSEWPAATHGGGGDDQNEGVMRRLDQVEVLSGSWRRIHYQEKKAGKACVPRWNVNRNIKGRPKFMHLLIV